MFRPLLQEIITIEHTLFLPDVQIKADFTFNSPFRFITVGKKSIVELNFNDDGRHIVPF